MPAGAKLPSSRALGQALGIARNTVLHVYEQLLAEGYVHAQSGSGTYVADTSPERVLDGDVRGGRRVQRDHQRLSKRGRRTIEMAGVGRHQWGAFMPGVPDVTEFPLKAWNRLHNRVWRQHRPELMTYAQGGGYRPLRRALADYLRVSRAANCQTEQVIVTNGIHQSVDLSIRLLCDVGDEAWVEEPCYWGVRNLLLSSGLKPVPIPVDAEGMNPAPRHLARPPRIIICTPSHQYPLGCVMSLARRRMLLEYARQHGCWIIEDDYDSEFRFGIRPLASLQGLDTYGQVIYVGSFSKVLFPGLRVGYMLVPGAMADLFAQGIAELYREGQMMLHAVLAEFIDEGYLASHIRRMRGLYAQRRELLIEAIHRHYGDALPILGDEAGLHLVLELPHLRDDWAVCARAADLGILAKPLSTYYAVARQSRAGLLMGYGCVPDARIAPAFGLLARAIGE
ncbi:GntR family transcriptional regulator [Paracidovorax anthurii]|uniref:GntR family transcriptional regulator n=1 Tax=Paracidovorax anthurii TaxID=78229 RepID=A0A328ZCC4_9BURK|nr:GntR family transcriptional regulator [Paracidovorax anthurii]